MALPWDFLAGHQRWMHRMGRTSALSVGALNLSCCFIQSRNQPVELEVLGEAGFPMCHVGARVLAQVCLLISPCPTPVSPTSAYEHFLVLPLEFGSRERGYRLGRRRKQDSGEEAPSTFILPSPFILFSFNSHFPRFKAPASPSPWLHLQTMCPRDSCAVGALFLLLERPYPRPPSIRKSPS